MMLVRKEIVVSGSWGGRSFVFRGGLLISPSFCAGLRVLRLLLLPVLSDAGAAVEALPVL